MSWETETGAIYERLIDVCESLGVNLYLPNMTVSDTPDELYVTGGVEPSESQQVGLYGSPYRSVGVLSCNVFVPGGEGEQAGIRTCDLIGLEFRGKTVGTSQFYTPSQSRLGRTAGGQWAFNLSCPFKFDEVAV